MAEIEYRPMTADDIVEVRALVESTVRTSYRGAYSQAAIEFFVQYHNENAIRNDLRKGVCIVACTGDEIVGTASLIGDLITRVFVMPRYQGNGVGGHLLRLLLARARSSDLDTLRLDASLVSRPVYEHLGFMVVADQWHDLGGGDALPYHEMVMRL